LLLQGIILKLKGIGSLATGTKKLHGSTRCLKRLSRNFQTGFKWRSSPANVRVYQLAPLFRLWSNRRTLFMSLVTFLICAGTCFLGGFACVSRMKSQAARIFLGLALGVVFFLIYIFISLIHGFSNVKG
jgi:hypothetical protein